MGFSRLPPNNIRTFMELPEIGMDIQIGKDANGRHILIISGRLTLTIDEALDIQMNQYREFMTSDETLIAKMERWTFSLPESETISPVPKEEALSVLGFINFGPIAPLPPHPIRPPLVYGHLPFHGICSGHEVFYRYEHYPTSLRIDLSAAEITEPDTYAAPMAEVPFAPTGLGAVARFALPSLLPARWRYEFRPAPGTYMKYGASVPLYGQSGGGVEVAFPQPFKNVGAIANPIVLPIF